MKIYLKISVWISLLGIFSYVGLAELFCIGSGVLIIFLNLGERKGASAYSVFNENYEKLPGDIDPTSMLKRKSGTKVTEEYVKPTYVIKNHRIPNKPCPCGSGKKHKKCCLHAKDIEDDF
jgi:Uncharacterized conserved domain (SAYSvFN)/SEC-C motif